MLHGLNFNFTRYKLYSYIYLQSRRKTGLLSSRGAEPSPADAGLDKAEIIPVEPEQDNACAGKVAFFLFFRLHFPTFRLIN
jgi:hypothetical protein